ncbi:E3 ubiquitin/ISG15 ligase TRIM25-like [Salarias fasciatus]|uniref:E3 ubiquitin/ISG15 ligase TRIM25-like n=1 Tax=Salarias fasciatus TaxID=181472 RepID=UPI00117667D5|nr:E3 ubiquitin/ISG15 ligase TRIM25-like [Salarias fasciatus]
MASAQPEQSRVLQDELTCTVCLDLYRDPHLLPCGHSFCKTCLDRLKRQANRGRLHCPECRDSHRCDTAFQKNFKLANIADDYRVNTTALSSRELLSSSLSAAGVSAVPCDYCLAVATETPGVSTAEEGASAASDSQEASAAASVAPMLAVRSCLKCEVSMCQEHVMPHLELPAFRQHPLIEPLNDFWKRRCPTHDEIFRYYRMDDRKCLCKACITEGRQVGHTVKAPYSATKDLQKFKNYCEQRFIKLGEEIKAKMVLFISRLQEALRFFEAESGLVIQKNISRISEDLTRLREARCSLEALMQENDPFRFIEAYQTTGIQCCTELTKPVFDPENVNMQRIFLRLSMDWYVKTFLEVELAHHFKAAIISLCKNLRVI